MRKQTLHAFGVVGPITYIIVIIIAGFLGPGYNHITQSMSELGEVSHSDSIIMNTFGFPLLGMSLVLFSLGFYIETKNGLISKIGPALIALSGVGLVFTGIFSL